jgi:tRNA pseudouridine38-40 synthase
MDLSIIDFGINFNRKMNKMRIALGIEYLGSDFFGWQYQPHARSVQACVETALSKVANHPVKVICAGRTDTGVHALGQVIHADITVQRTMRSWRLGTNTHLPNDVSVLWVQSVEENFHARFSALARYYRYVILNRPSRPAVLLKKTTWAFKKLDIEAMQTAGNYLLGKHDFSSYRAVSCQAKTPIRTISYLNVSRINELVIIDISANAFLHHMVRNIAGVLMNIGYGEQPPEWAKIILDARDRTKGGVTAPPDGLYLCAVDYPSPYVFPKVNLNSLF